MHNHPSLKFKEGDIFSVRELNKMEFNWFEDYNGLFVILSEYRDKRINEIFYDGHYLLKKNI